ncbi:hypothetical protein [Azospirillum tabaci]|uniref:hypothetical protein n=1 Tax=Azospirillum tabaci TaxID=2752310 RepID=UPI001660D93C|nr:hypothetical protein [Azospirillum tabaci]
MSDKITARRSREPFEARGRFIWGGPTEHDAIVGEVYDNGQPFPEEMAKVWAASYQIMFPALAEIRNRARSAVLGDSEYPLLDLAWIADTAANALPVPTIGDVNGTAPEAPRRSSVQEAAPAVPPLGKLIALASCVEEKVNAEGGEATVPRIVALTVAAINEAAAQEAAQATAADGVPEVGLRDAAESVLDLVETLSDGDLTIAGRREIADLRSALSGTPVCAKIIPYTDEDDRPDPAMNGLVMLAIGRDVDAPDHVLDRIPDDAAETLVRLLSSAPAAPTAQGQVQGWQHPSAAPTERGAPILLKFRVAGETHIAEGSVTDGGCLWVPYVSFHRDDPSVFGVIALPSAPSAGEA